MNAGIISGYFSKSVWVGVLAGCQVAVAASVVESEKVLSLVQDVDVVVVGGGVGAVAAALKAKEAGARVFLVAPRPYLGEDLAGKMRLWLDSDEDTRCALLKRIFTVPEMRQSVLSCKYPAGSAGQVKGQTTPLRVKKVLDEALLQAKISFLTGAFATELLVDAAGELSGVVMANRSGRQAVKARVVIDATERGMLARAAGAKATPFPAGTYTFRRVIMAGEAPQAIGVRIKDVSGHYDTRVTGVKPPKGMPKTICGRMFECEFDLPMKDGSAAAFAEAEQLARDLTFVPTQLESADTLIFTPPDRFIGKASFQGTWRGVDGVDGQVFQPAGVENLFVLSALADVSRQAAEQLMKPGNLMGAGERVGAAAAAAAAKRAAVGDVRVPGDGTLSRATMTVCEHRQGLPAYLSNVSGSVRAEPRELPLLAECDVVVAGAGTGGAPAGIAASRQGAKTIVCEYLYQMGGVQTEGQIGKYWYGNTVGFTCEIDEGVSKTGAVLSQSKSEWYRRENRKAGSDIWYGTLVSGVIVENGVLIGVVVVTPGGGRGVIRCKVAIDATGNAELPALAGEETEFITSEELALQGAGQTSRNLGESYGNNDFGFIDDTDAADLFFFALRSRLGMGEKGWDQAQIINSRERRRMLGAFYMTPLDVANQRTYPDVVVQTRSNFDTHGYTVHEQFFIDNPSRKPMMVNLPYRCMLPKRIDGLLVVGLGLSAHRDAMPILRMQPDVQNQGYAAGVAAAMAVKDGVAVRHVDMGVLQRHLVEKKVLPEVVLTWKDSFPLPDAAFTEAVAKIPQNYEGFKVVLTDYGRGVPLLKEAFKKETDPVARFKYAHVLAMMGHADGEDLLIEKLMGMKWDQGWNFRGMGQANRSVSWVDSYIIALGRAKSKKAVPAILDKARVLTAANEFSHFRAVAMALEAISDRSAVPVLGELLARPGVSGHSIAMQGQDIPVLLFSNNVNKEGDKERSACLRELTVARALCRLGDFKGSGEKVLRAYANDPRGAYANYAKLVLSKQ